MSRFRYSPSPPPNTLDMSYYWIIRSTSRWYTSTGIRNCGKAMVFAPVCWRGEGGCLPSIKPGGLNPKGRGGQPPSPGSSKVGGTYPVLVIKSECKKSPRFPRLEK